ncbi:hypothetical protein [Nocardia sp. NPDC024068]|uniref:hypothetical protein n=1 Tax=Nocardia sp. NPDC024068 TaxID=3157197 RepID=UPI0033CB9E8A
MKISAGAPGWYEACSQTERANTVALAATRWKWSVVWSVLSGVGLALALGLAVGALLPLRWPVSDIPFGVWTVALVALSVDLAVLVPNGMAWSRVGLVFSGAAPDSLVLPFRWLRWVPTSLVSLFGTVAMLVVGVHPLAEYGESGLRGLSFTDWLTAVVAVLCVLCGLSTLWLKVLLRPVRSGP